jgi:hypothetical protein
MSITNLAKNAAAPDVGAQPSSPTFHDLLTFIGDAAYPTGGSPGFAALLQSLFGDHRTPLAIISQDCAGYDAVYDPTNDKVKVYAANNTEVANATNLSAVTFKVLVISY